MMFLCRYLRVDRRRVHKVRTLEYRIEGIGDRDGEDNLNASGSYFDPKFPEVGNGSFESEVSRRLV